MICITGWSIRWGGANEFVVATEDDDNLHQLELHAESREFLLPNRPPRLPHYESHRIPAEVFVAMLAVADGSMKP